MVYVYGHYKYLTLSVRDRLWTSESDVYRRRILTFKVGPRAERVTDFKTDKLIDISIIFTISMRNNIGNYC